MKNRILATLELAQSDQRFNSEHQRVTWDLANAALKQDANKAWNIIKNPSRLRVQTIDSLCASLSRQMPILSRLGAQPEIVDDIDPLYEQAAIYTLAELESDEPYANAIATLLLHLDNDLPRIRSLIIGMLKKRDQWLRYVAQIHDRSDLEQSLRKVIEEELAKLVTIFPDDVETRLCDLLRYAAQNLKEENKANSIIHCESLTTIPGEQVEDLEKWLGIVELLLTRKNKWRKSFTKTIGFPPAAKDSKLESKKRASMKKHMEDLIERLSGVKGLQQQLAEVRVLPLSSYNDHEWEAVNALCVCLTVAAAQLRVCFAERNETDYIGMAQAAIEALGEDDAPTDLALYLDYQIKHLLVDEFQDISINQRHLITQLCHGWVEGDGRSLFLVGDPMQSIYRFREAEVGIFINTFNQQRLGHIRLVALRLSVNFRSGIEIINWVNDCFSEILPAQDEGGTGAVSYMPSIARHDKGTASAVSLCPLFNYGGLQEAKYVRDIVESIRLESQSTSIVILVRNRTHLNEIIPLLRKAGILFRAIDIEGLGQQPAIQDVLALTRAYTYLGDRIAWLAVLRAPWCGLLLNDLHTLVNYQNESTIWAAMNNRERRQQLTGVSQARLDKIIQCFTEAFANKRRQTLSRTVETLWIRLGGPATLNSENDLENITTFFGLLERFDVGGSLEKLDHFLKNVKQLYAAPDQQAENALQIMTIHKSKGLEFDHVIVPGLGHGQRISQDDLLVWTLRPNQQQGNDLILAPIKETGVKGATVYQYLSHIEKEKRSYEEIRLLYVATTRAKKSLHLIGHAKLKKDKQGDIFCEPATNSLLSYLWPVLKHEFEEIMPKHIEDNFIKAGILFRAIDIEGLGQQPAIQDVLALTRAYTYLGDRIAWLAVLRAPWCGLLLNDLHTLVNYQNESTIWAAMNNRERRQQLTGVSQARLDKIIQCFTEAFANKRRQTLSRTVETLWIRLGGPATLNSENDLENITTFFGLLERFDVGGSLEKLDHFLKNVKQLYAAPDQQAENALQIMTIHKSKGLEFDHVIVPGLGHGQRISQDDLLVWTLRPNQQQGNDLILAPINRISPRFTFANTTAATCPSWVIAYKGNCGSLGRSVSQSFTDVFPVL